LNFRQQVGIRTQCAGGGCPDKDGCLRFALRAGQPLWASFDIERESSGGPCLHRLPVEAAGAMKKGLEEWRRQNQF